MSSISLVLPYLFAPLKLAARLASFHLSKELGNRLVYPLCILFVRSHAGEVTPNARYDLELGGGDVGSFDFAVFGLERMWSGQLALEAGGKRWRKKKALRESRDP